MPAMSNGNSHDSSTRCLESRMVPSIGDWRAYDNVCKVGASAYFFQPRHHQELAVSKRMNLLVDPCLS